MIHRRTIPWKCARSRHGEPSKSALIDWTRLFQARLPAASRIGPQPNALTGPNDGADATETAARPSYDEQTDGLLARAASWPPGCIVLPLVRDMIRNLTFSG